MKNITTIIAALVLTTLSINTFAQNSDAATANASARIITKITVAKDVDLNFGTIAQTVTGGNVILSASSNEATYTNPSSVILSSEETRAHFNVTGEADATYGITLPTEVSITRAEGSETMTVTDFVTASLTGNTLTNGNGAFYVGATLEVGANQVAGQYNGTFPVTVTYE